MVAAPAFFAPITTLGDHHGFVTRDYRLLAIGAGTTALGYAVLTGLERAGLRRRSALDLTVVLMSGVAFGGSLASSLPGGTVGTLGLLLLFLATMMAVRRLSIVHLMVTWWTLLLALLQLWAVVQIPFGDDSTIVDSDPAGRLDIANPGGDVVIAILDEYPSSEFQDSHLGGLGTRVVSRLEDVGFEVDGSVPVSYAFTELVLPAFFSLDLPVGEGAVLNETARAELLGSLGGNNPIVEAFRSEGFHITVVESGWSGLRCMAPIDRCITRSWYDEVTASVIDRSLLAPVTDRLFGHPFTHGALRVMRWINHELPQLVVNEEDDFVVVHVMVPHTPLALSRTCERRSQAEPSDRDALIEQAHCANAIVGRIAAATEDAGLTVIMGDHGTSLHRQVELAPEEWTAEMIRERMRTLVAVRGLGECGEPRPASSVNVAIRLMRCLGGDLQYVEDVSYVTSIHGEPLVNRYRR